MPRLPVLSGLEVVKILSKAGWDIARQRGSHIVMIKFFEDRQNPKDSANSRNPRDFADGKRALVVPNHREVDTGTLIDIIRQARLTREEFEKLI